MLVAAAAVLAVIVWWMLGRDSGHATHGAGVSGAKATEGGGGGGGSAATKIARRDVHAEAAASLAGVIRSTAGAGIAGAWVCADTRGDELSDDDHREPRCVVSDAAGAYRIDGLFASRWSVEAGADGKIPAAWKDPQTDKESVRIAAGEARTGIDLVLEDGGVLAEGVVLDLTGGPVADAHVALSGGWRSGHHAACHTRSGADGTFRCWVAPGELWAQAAADGYTDGWSQGQAPGEHLEILLTPESTISGRVVLAGTGEPVAGATVELAGEWGWAETHVFSGPDGRFQITRMAPGRYHPTAPAPGLYGEARESVLVGLAQSRDDVVIEMYPATTVRGLVAVAAAGDVAGEPLEDCWVSLSRGDGRRYTKVSTVDGVALFEAVQPGRYEVGVECDDHVSRTPYGEIVVADEPVEATWLVDDGLVVLGTVVDEHGKPVAHASVWGRSVGGDPRAARGQSGDDTDADGSFELKGLSAGDVELNVSAEDLVSPKDPPKVAAGTRDARVVLTAGGAIEGSVVDEAGKPLGKLEVSAEGERWRGSASARTRDDGTFSMKGVDAGNYRVTASRSWKPLRKPGTTDDDLQGERVTVSAGVTTKVHLIVEDSSGTIRGKVLDAAGQPVGDAFLRAERESDAAGRQQGGGMRDARWSWGKRPSVTAVDGTFAIEDLTPGNYTVLAYRKGGSEAKAEGVAVGTSVTLTIEATGSMSGTVVAASGVVPREVSISIEDPRTGLQRTETYFMTQGTFAIRDLPAGSYNVTANATEGVAHAKAIAIAEGQDRTGVELKLAATVTITGRVNDAATGAPVPAMRVAAQPVDGANGGRIVMYGGDPGNDEVSDAQGRFTAKDVPTGRAHLVAYPRDWGTGDYDNGARMVDIQGTGTVDVGDLRVRKRRLPRDGRAGDLGFTLAQNPPDVDPADVVLEVASIRKDGPAAGTGLAVGDVIVTVDGEPVAGEEAWSYWSLIQVPEGTVVNVGLERGATVKIRAGRPE
jgi:protocatechuate 3,4-dioxygenase beta subunit